MSLKSLAKTNEKGFTIVELMIALAILATLLLLSTVTLIQLGNLFTKGTHQADIQNTARNVLNQMSSEIQFGASDPSTAAPIRPGTGSVCIGTARYSFILNTQLSPSVPHVFWRDTLITNSGSCPALDITSANPADTHTNPAVPGQEVIGPNTSVGSLSVLPHNGVVTVQITLAYSGGGVDLLNGSGTQCLANSSSHYCAVASLTKTVSRRLSQ